MAVPSGKPVSFLLALSVSFLLALSVSFLLAFCGSYSVPSAFSVLFCSSCQNKAPQPRCLKQQKLIFS